MATSTTATAKAASSTNCSRKDGVDALIAYYEDKYNHNTKDGSKSFFLNPNIAFVSGPEGEDGGGVSVLAAAPIKKGDVLFCLPKEERFSMSNITEQSNPFLKSLLKAIKDDFSSKKNIMVLDRGTEGEKVGTLDGCYRYGDICLIVMVMEALGEDRVNTKPWPSLQEMKETCYTFWELQSDIHHNTAEEGETDVTLASLLKGTSTWQALQDFITLRKYSFDEIVKPALEQTGDISKFIMPSLLSQQRQQQDDDDDNHQETMDSCLWQTYQYASAIVRSRTHEGTLPEEPEILPLVDLMNGYPDQCHSKINVELGPVMIHAEGLPRSAVYAIQDIAQGRELLLSYGSVSASQFAMKYACLPAGVLEHPKACLDYIKVCVPPWLAPPDALRKEAAEKSSFPTTAEQIQRDLTFELSYDAFDKYTQQQQQQDGNMDASSSSTFDGESDQLKGMRQFLILCHVLDEDGVRDHLETGRLKGNYPHVQLGHAHLLVLDHSLSEGTTLNASTNQEDLAKADLMEATPGCYDLAMAYRIRVCQRESYSKWRHAVCRRYQYVSQPAEPAFVHDQFIYHADILRKDLIQHLPKPKAPDCLMASRACPMCGRTIHLQPCDKCQSVQYCGPEHQELDWKAHKPVCLAVADGSAVAAAVSAISDDEPYQDDWSDSVD